MFEFVSNIGNDLHPIINHFPIGLLTVSFVLAFVARVKPELETVEWWTFAIGALMTLPATITGLAAHIPYEEMGIETIEIHQFLSMGGTLLMLIAVVWRYFSRRRERDIGKTQLYLLFAVVGVVWIFMAGGTGGSLTYDYGINVRGVNPLLP